MGKMKVLILCATFVLLAAWHAESAEMSNEDLENSINDIEERSTPDCVNKASWNSRPCLRESSASGGSRRYGCTRGRCWMQCGHGSSLWSFLIIEYDGMQDYSYCRRDSSCRNAARDGMIETCRG